MNKFFILPIAFVMSISVASAQSAESEAGVLPGEALSVLDVLAENLGNAFAFGHIAKAERLLGQANERLAEAKALTEKGDNERAEQAIENYEERLAAAVERAEKAKEEGQDSNDVLTRISEATFKHQEVLIELLSKVPEQARSGIQNAIDNSVKGHNQALDAAAKEPAANSKKPADAGRPE